MNANETEIIVLDTDDAAAKRVTVTGWMSRLGHFFGDNERAARYDGCTHRNCEECGKIVSRSWIICPACLVKRTDAKFLKLERVQWDEETPVVLYDSDVYFFDRESIEDYCRDEGLNIEDLRLIICVPVKPREVDANEIFYDQLPEDGEVEDAGVLAAIEALNKALDAAKPFSWIAGNVVAILR